ncbi:MAG: hypothetical protein EXR27_11085 [Betaproteobacteria bacterium]|nr:hypothetical protein [Betaproteobacteria bacterium]
MLSLHFVKSGAFPNDTTRNLNSLMALRHAADYKGDVSIDANEVRRQRLWVMRFVSHALACLKSGPAKADLKIVEKGLGDASAVGVGDAGGNSGVSPTASSARKRR